MSDKPYAEITSISKNDNIEGFNVAFQLYNLVSQGEATRLFIPIEGPGPTITGAEMLSKGILKDRLQALIDSLENSD